MDKQPNQKNEHKVGEDQRGLGKRQQPFLASSSSPTHDFSFTVSFQHSKSPPLAAAVDLSPADEIFFHGHLLPLCLLSHLPLSPRSSTSTSLEIDTFTIPIKEDQRVTNIAITSPSYQTRERPKSKSFFGLQLKSRRRKGSLEEREKKRRKLTFSMSRVIKRYMRVIRPLLLFRAKRAENVVQLPRKAYSFSDYFSPKRKREMRERVGGFSAPVSTWTSPRNSGRLVANSSVSSTKSDSTMEELQAAIQAAIAHCKDSISVDEKNQKISND